MEFGVLSVIDGVSLPFPLISSVHAVTHGGLEYLVWWD